jgi:hypothetical protein
MAPAVNNGHRQSSRWLSGEVSSDTFPPWTRGDDIDADTRLLVEAKARGRRHRKRQASDDGIIRAETHQIGVATEFDPQPTTALSEPVPAPSQVDPSTTIASVGPPESASIPSSTSDVAPTTAPADVTTADPVSSTTAVSSCSWSRVKNRDYKVNVLNSHRSLLKNRTLTLILTLMTQGSQKATLGSQKTTLQRCRSPRPQGRPPLLSQQYHQSRRRYQKRYYRRGCPPLPLMPADLPSKSTIATSRRR